MFMGAHVGYYRGVRGGNKMGHKMRVCGGEYKLGRGKIVVDGMTSVYDEHGKGILAWDA